MQKLYYDKTRFIAYNHFKSNKKDQPTIIFLHGLMSDMHSTKSLYIADYCKIHEYDFITFDNFGHGKSSGLFTDETIGSWLLGAKLVLDKLVSGSAVIIGSSKGAWLAFLLACKYPKKIKGMVCIAPAIDFTERLIWQSLTEEKQRQMMTKGWLEISGQNCGHKYPISYKLILEARNHLLLSSNMIELDIPIHLIHGMKDIDVPYTTATLLYDKIVGDQVVLKLIKDADHRLNRGSDLQIIANSLEEVMLNVH